MERSRKRRRTTLRFESLASVKVPNRFLKIDTALDMLGEQLRPDDWGYAPKFANLPFSYQTGTYLWHQFEENEGRWHLSREPIPVSESDRGPFFELKQMFDLVCRRFVEGCEESHFGVSLLDAYRGLLDFPQTTAVTTQSIAIFETGHAFPPDSQVKPLPVVVDKSGFEGWIVTRAKEDQRATAKTVTEARKQRLFDAVKQFAKQHEIQLEKKWMWEVMSAAAGPGLSRNRFEKDWKLIPLTEKGVSRPPKAVGTRRDSLKEDAIRAAKDALDRGGR